MNAFQYSMDNPLDVKQIHTTDHKVSSIFLDQWHWSNEDLSEIYLTIFLAH